MGYFPNGTSGAFYEDRYCSDCVHGQHPLSNICPVMVLHDRWNYEACNGGAPAATPETKAKFLTLETLIPTTKNGLGCEQCMMFHPTTEAKSEMVEDKTEALREWEAIYGRRTA
jgi:hypothetical protein